MDELVSWVSSHVPSAGVVGLMTALQPSVLLHILALVAPACAGEPPLSSACGSAEKELLATVYYNACRRLGMRFVCAPQEPYPRAAPK